LCDAGCVAVKVVFKLLSFFTFIFAVCDNFPTVLIARVGMFNSIKFITSLNANVTVVFSDRDCL